MNQSLVLESAANYTAIKAFRVKPGELKVNSVYQ